MYNITCQCRITDIKMTFEYQIKRHLSIGDLRDIVVLMFFVIVGLVHTADRKVEKAGLRSHRQF